MRTHHLATTQPQLASRLQHAAIMNPLCQKCQDGKILEDQHFHIKMLQDKLSKLQREYVQYRETFKLQNEAQSFGIVGNVAPESHLDSSSNCK